MSCGQGLPTQLQCFYQVLRKVQKLEMWEVTEVFHLLDLVSCQRQEAAGGRKGCKDRAASWNHGRKGGGLQAPGDPG